MRGYVHLIVSQFDALNTNSPHQLFCLELKCETQTKAKEDFRHDGRGSIAILTVTITCICYVGYFGSTYPFLGLTFLFRGRVHGLHHPFDAVVCSCTKDGQPHQHAKHFISGQRPEQGLSGEIFQKHIYRLLSGHWL